MQALIGKRVDVTLQKPARLYLPAFGRMCRIIAVTGLLREADEFWATFDLEQIQVHPDDAKEGDDGRWRFSATLVYRIDDIVSFVQLPDGYGNT